MQPQRRALGAGGETQLTDRLRELRRDGLVHRGTGRRVPGGRRVAVHGGGDRGEGVRPAEGRRIITGGAGDQASVGLADGGLCAVDRVVAHRVPPAPRVTRRPDRGIRRGHGAVGVLAQGGSVRDGDGPGQAEAAGVPGEDAVTRGAPVGGGQPGQDLRATGDDIQIVGVHGPWGGRGRAVSTTDPEDSHVAVAEGRLLGEPRGVPQSAQHRPRAGRVGDPGEIGADQQIADPLLGQRRGEGFRGSPRVELALDPVEPADRLGWDQRYRVPDDPGDVEQCLGRLIAGVSPVLPGGRGPRQNHRAGVRRPVRRVIEPVRGFRPVGGDGPVTVDGHQPGGPGRGGEGGDEQSDGGHHDHRPVLLGVCPVATLRPPRHAHPAQQVGEADDQRQVDQGVELVEVAQRSACAVEEGPGGVLDRGERSGDTEDEQPAAQHHQPHVTVGHPGA